MKEHSKRKDKYTKEEINLSQHLCLVEQLLCPDIMGYSPTQVHCLS